MGVIYVIGAAKGGTAKTVTTYNLAYSLMELGKRVLAVDMDPQANLTTCFGVENPAEVSVTIGHLLMNVLEDEELPNSSEYIGERNCFADAFRCGSEAEAGNGGREDAWQGTGWG